MNNESDDPFLLISTQSDTQYDRKGLLRAVREQLKINYHGIHGANHWARVLRHGLTVGKERGADLLVVELFAFLHDSQRFSDVGDKWHGLRAADYAISLQGEYFDLLPTQLDDLCYAMKWHSYGSVQTKVNLQTCWDADRLDLGRVNKTPDPKLLSEEAAKYIESAVMWSKKVQLTINYSGLPSGPSDIPCAFKK